MALELGLPLLCDNFFYLITTVGALWSDRPTGSPDVRLFPSPPFSQNSPSRTSSFILPTTPKQLCRTCSPFLFSSLCLGRPSRPPSSSPHYSALSSRLPIPGWAGTLSRRLSQRRRSTQRAGMRRLLRSHPAARIPRVMMTACRRCF